MPRRQWRSVWSLEERASAKWYNNQSLHAMSGTLYVVATPIGNLEDITLRALRVLREVDLIAAEDTRRTARLLAHHAIPTPTISFHEHNSKSRVPQLLDRLARGMSIAVVTDAGTPGVSDPGVDLVAACIDAGIPVDPLPGASAPLVAAVASGFSLERLTLLGFSPSRSKDRTRWLSEVALIPNALCFFESPHRIEATLEEAALIFGERPICLGRELTKAHQEFLRGTAAEVLSKLGEPRGEFTVVVAPMVLKAISLILPDDASIAVEFGLQTNNRGLGRRQAVAAVARKYGRPTREVYAAIERAKQSVK
jgi:16S rRNA (cytidine1402-2'-O)-methyltransferase